MLKELFVPALIFAGIGILSGILLTVFSKLFHVETDERLEKITECLPGANCGGCGYAGCSDYANAIINGEKSDLCLSAGEKNVSEIDKIMGRTSSPSSSVKKVAFIRCQGDLSKSEELFEFRGKATCKSSNRFYSGSKRCPFGCLGLGDCKAVCPHDAITICEGLARVNPDKCVGCGLCVNECPNNLIIIKDKKEVINVACNCDLTGKETRENCKSGCIGCRLCERNCPKNAITVRDNIAVIDYEKCVSCGICIANCPSKTIVDIRNFKKINATNSVE